MSLGRARGVALLGRALDLSIPVTLDRAEEESPCTSGELFYGDQRIERGLVLRWQPGPGSQGTVHVSSPLPVSEPVVTLDVRVGCGQPTTRRYVLFSELPARDEHSLPGTRATVPAVPAPAPAVAVAAPASGAAAPRRAPAPMAAPAPRAAPAPKPPRARKEAAEPPASRLKVDPVAIGLERDPVLRLTAELATQLAADPQQRQAAAALWAALQKSPDEALQDAQQVQGLQREILSLRDVTRQNAAAVGQMRAQVERARGERESASVLVLVLTALLAAVLAWIGWRWYRLRQVDRVGRWFEAQGDAALQPVIAAAAQAPAAPAKPRGKAKAAAAAATAAAAAAPTPAAPAGAPARHPTAPISSWATVEEFQPSRGGTVRMVGVQELIDVHDKADFFLSLGQPEQAIAVLEAHVHDQVETSALAWMDLLELYHAHGKRLEYERLRGEFRQHFAVEVPDYEHFDQPTASLENYSRALSRIVALWPSHKVLDVIEESIFRRPGLPGAEPFSLEAYRDLILLYHVAKEVAPQEEGTADGRRTNFSDTSLQPLNAVERPDAPPADREQLMVPPRSARVGVDIDLGDLDEPAVAAAGPDAAPRGAGELGALDFDVSSYDDVDGATPKA